MLSCWRGWKLVIVTCACLAVAAGCGGDQPEKETTAVKKKKKKKKKTVDYQVFAPLPAATTKGALPYLVDEDGVVETPCFAKQDIAPSSAGMDIRRVIEDNSETMNEAIRSWFVEDISPSGLSSSMASSWEVEVEDPVVLEVPPDQIQLAEGQECIDKDTGWLQSGVRAVTTLIGARSFHFTTSKPIDVDLQQDMLAATQEAGFKMESEALFAYQPALDDNGEQMAGPDGGLLFRAPDGTNVLQKDIPPEEERTMKEWTVSAEQPIFFGFRELSDDAWHRENKKDKCNVYLVWGDPTPRPPDCDEYQLSSFTATKNDGGLSITVTTGDLENKVKMGYGDVEMLAVSSRIVLWISPKKIEEGVMIRLNSLVLGDPATAARPSTGGAAPAFEMQSVPDKKKKKKKKKEKKQKKAKKAEKAEKASPTNLDDYLK